jgi:hypothetical protein
MVKPYGGSWDVVPYRGAADEIEALRSENERLRVENARLVGDGLIPFCDECPRCGDFAASEYDTRVWRNGRRGIFGLFARPAHFYRRCATCKATWREAPRNAPESVTP